MVSKDPVAQQAAFAMKLGAPTTSTALVEQLQHAAGISEMQACRLIRALQSGELKGLTLQQEG